MLSSHSHGYLTVKFSFNLSENTVVSTAAVCISYTKTLIFKKILKKHLKFTSKSDIIFK